MCNIQRVWVVTFALFTLLPSPLRNLPVDYGHEHIGPNITQWTSNTVEPYQTYCSFTNCCSFYDRQKLTKLKPTVSMFSGHHKVTLRATCSLWASLWTSLPYRGITGSSIWAAISSDTWCNFSFEAIWMFSCSERRRPHLVVWPWHWFTGHFPSLLHWPQGCHYQAQMLGLTFMKESISWVIPRCPILSNQRIKGLKTRVWPSARTLNVSKGCFPPTHFWLASLGQPDWTRTTER